MVAEQLGVAIGPYQKGFLGTGGQWVRVNVVQNLCPHHLGHEWSDDKQKRPHSHYIKTRKCNGAKADTAVGRM